MKTRILGSICGLLLGAFVGSGTGIVGGIFGAVAGASIFMIAGAVWGFSAGPDIAQILERFRRK